MQLTQGDSKSYVHLTCSAHGKTFNLLSFSSPCRYMEKNVRCHRMYRTYNKELPEFLVNRPRYFVEHCKEKISLAMDIKKSSIKPSDTGGVFEVKSESSRRRWYRLQFGHKEGTSPSCECEAWQRRRLPCKHFFAIFKHFPVWNWEKLPQNYRNSPYLTLDYHLLNGSSPFPSPSSVLPEANSDIPQLDEPLPKKILAVFKRKRIPYS